MIWIISTTDFLRKAKKGALVYGCEIPKVAAASTSSRRAATAETAVYSRAEALCHQLSRSKTRKFVSEK